MRKNYSIPELLSLAGIRGYTPRLASAVNTLVTTQNDIEYQSALREATQEITGYSTTYNGTEETLFAGNSNFEGLPLYMPLVFEKLKNGTSSYMLDSAIVDLNRQKNIVTTIVQGRDSSVKELINNGDYQITVSGVIANKELSYPKESVKELEAFLSAKESLKVTHEIMNALGINELVITDYNIPTTPFINMQAYSFNAISDTPIELIINERL